MFQLTVTGDYFSPEKLDAWLAEFQALNNVTAIGKAIKRRRKVILSKTTADAVSKQENIARELRGQTRPEMGKPHQKVRLRKGNPPIAEVNSRQRLRVQCRLITILNASKELFVFSISVPRLF